MVALLALLIVAALVGLPALAMLLDTRSTGPAPTPTVSLSAGEWNRDQVAVMVTAVHTDALDASLFGFKVEAGNGDVYFWGPSGSTHARHGALVRLDYFPLSPLGTAGRGDSILITVSPPDLATALHGCVLKIVLGSDVLGTTALP